jgi:hypothetical protein
MEVVFAQVAVEDLGASEPLGETEEQGGVIDPLMGQGEGVGPGGVIPRGGGKLSSHRIPGSRGTGISASASGITSPLSFVPRTGRHNC